jgi:predicted TIM-barrel fold metal-dependent hydrolase
MGLLAEGAGAPGELLEDLQSFYFDTALSGSPAALPSLLAFAKPGHVLFGSDWPYAPAPIVSYFSGHLDAYTGLDEAGHRAVDRESAAALFAKET